MAVDLTTIDWATTELISGENDPQGQPDTFNRACKQIWDIFRQEHDKDGDHKSDLLSHYFQMEEDTYTGDGAATQTITLTDSALIPVFVMVFSDTATPVYFRLKESVMAGDSTKYSNAVFTANFIESTTTGQFVVGDDAGINTNLTVYYYFVFGTH